MSTTLTTTSTGQSHTSTSCPTSSPSSTVCVMMTTTGNNTSNDVVHYMFMISILVDFNILILNGFQFLCIHGRFSQIQSQLKH